MTGAFSTLFKPLPSPPSLMEQALTHASCLNQAHNERLEFLGDAAVGLFLAQWLYQRDPHAPEGLLSRQRSQLCCEKSLAYYTQKLGIVPLLKVQQNELRHKPSVQADAFEALCGAIFVEQGYDGVHLWLEHQCATLFLTVLSEQQQKDPKSALQEYTQKKQWGLPQYELIGTTGPANALNFCVKGCIAGHTARAQGPTKKQAEQDVATQLLELLRSQENDS